MIPAANVLIESGGPIEHGLMSVTLLVSQALMSSLNVVLLEGIRHVSHSPSTPLGDIAVLTGVTTSKPISNRRVKVTIGNGRAGGNTATSKRTAVVSERVTCTATEVSERVGRTGPCSAIPFDNLIGLAGGWGRG